MKSEIHGGSSTIVVIQSESKVIVYLLSTANSRLTLTYSLYSRSNENAEILILESGKIQLHRSLCQGNYWMKQKLSDI